MGKKHPSLYNRMCFKFKWFSISLSPIDHHSGPHRILDKLFSNTRYFVMKSNNHENIVIAKERVSTN